MAELFTNMLRMRMLQLGAGIFFAAVLVTNVDVKSIIIGNEPPIPTQTTPPPVHITTMKPSSTPLIWSTDPVKIPDYEPTTHFPGSSAVKSIYVFDYVLEQPAVKTPRPEAIAEPPPLPFETDSTEAPTEPSTLPRPPLMAEDSAIKENSTHTSSSTNQSLPKPYWILNSIQGVLIDMKDHICKNFPGLAPTFGMVAWSQLRYMQYLRGTATAENFRSIARKLASHTAAKNREADQMRMLLNAWENGMTEAIERLEVVVTAKQISNQKAAYKSARLQSMIVEGQHALTREQQTSKQQSEKAARDTSRLDISVKGKDETIATMGIETQKLRKEIEDLAKKAKELKKERDEALKNAVDTGAADKATIAQLKIQAEEAKKKGEAAEEEGLEKQSTIDFLTNTLATNNTAFIEADNKAKEAKENAEETEKALREHIAELVEQHKEKAAQSSARNKKIKDELGSEKEERLRLISSNENQRVKDAEEGRMRAEEAARRANGEANHMVQSQVGQLNRAKAMNDAYRARYGKLNESNTTNASTTTTSSAHASSSAPNVSLNGSDRPSRKEADKDISRSSAVVNPDSSESAATWVSQKL